MLGAKLNTPPAYSVFHSALERAAKAEDTVPLPVSMEVLDAWLEHARLPFPMGRPALPVLHLRSIAGSVNPLHGGRPIASS